MTDPEYAVISEWFNFLITCPQLNFKIDQIVYLRTDPEVAYERIKKRKRPEEHLIPFSYLKGSIQQFTNITALVKVKRAVMLLCQRLITQLYFIS